MWFAHLKSRSVIDVVDEFVGVKVLRSLSGVQLLLCVEVLQPLMVCVDVDYNTYEPISLFPETIYTCKQFFVMDWPVPLCSEHGF